MYKRLLIGFFAACLLVAWVIPQAEGAVRRYRTILNEHFFNDCPDPNVYEVSDQLYGVAWVDGAWVASCKMTGLVYCNTLDPTLCPVDIAAPLLNGELDFVAPQVLAVLSDVAEHGVDGLSGIFRRTALGAPGFERFGQLLDLLADVAKRCRLLFGR